MQQNRSFCKNLTSILKRLYTSTINQTPFRVSSIMLVLHLLLYNSIPSFRSAFLNRNRLGQSIYRMKEPFGMLIAVVPIRLCWFSKDPSRESSDVLSDARSKRIRKRSRMRRNLLLISCNLMLLDLGRTTGSVDIQRNEKVSH